LYVCVGRVGHSIGPSWYWAEYVSGPSWFWAELTQLDTNSHISVHNKLFTVSSTYPETEDKYLQFHLTESSETHKSVIKSIHGMIGV